MVLLPAERHKAMRFNISAKPGSKVFVAGTFNNWDPTENQLKDNPNSGEFKATLKVPPGIHQYKFIVNGEWKIDPNCKSKIPNKDGTMNSVLWVW